MLYFFPVYLIFIYSVSQGNNCQLVLIFTYKYSESGVRATRSLVLCVCFVDRCLFFCPFSFGHCVVHVLSDGDVKYLEMQFTIHSKFTDKTTGLHPWEHISFS
jgi:hypothetical protein